MLLEYLSNPPIAASSLSSYNINLLDESELSHVTQPELVPLHATLVIIC